MAIVTASDEAAAIISHYLRQLAQRAGIRWTEANDRDMARLSSLLDQAGSAAEQDDTIPPFERPVVSDRVTQVFDREPEPPSLERQQWDAFHRWQTERAEDERVEQARRIMRR